ncbi:BTB/POZ domain-containing protein KCTD9-like [Orbicella faveolata]|uniref:BTB/POZ domain-containing protein KCTD9-like n=1 Tax=Orbicella faveolata TaxID=48498 RepID=UPI0009E61971|nr:BTB/POZ domain-containing protein KCTD9-like [Orbicella faveolata]
MPQYVQKRVMVFAKGRAPVVGKVIAVPGTLKDLLLAAQCKLGLHRAVAVYTKNGGLIDDVDLIRDDEVLFVSSENPAVGRKIFPDFYFDLIIFCSLLSIKCCFIITCIVVNITCNSFISFLLSSLFLAFTDWVTLNVGGTMFTTTRSTLMNEPNSMLSRMFSPADSWSNITDPQGAVLIDRSPVYFEPILNYLRHGQLILDKGVNPQGVLEEAKFFGISSVLEQLEEMVKSMERSDDAPLSRSEFVKILLSTPSNCELRCQVHVTPKNTCKLSVFHLYLVQCKTQCRKMMLVASLLRKWLPSPAISLFPNSRAQIFPISLQPLSSPRSWRAEDKRHWERDLPVSFSLYPFKGAILSCTRLQRAQMEGASLRGCNFEDPAGTRANLEGVNLKNSDLGKWSKMSQVLLSAGLSLVFTEKNLVDLVWEDHSRPDPPMAGLMNCNLTGCDLQDANLRGANITGATIAEITGPLHMTAFVRNQLPGSALSVSSTPES